MANQIEALLKSLFAEDENGTVFLRVANSKPEGEIKNAVNSQSSKSLQALLKSVIVLDEDNNPALLLHGVEAVKSLMTFEKEQIVATTKKEGERQEKIAKEVKTKKNSDRLKAVEKRRAARLAAEKKSAVAAEKERMAAVKKRREKRVAANKKKAPSK